MNRFFRKIFLGLAAVSVAGCSGINMPSLGDVPWGKRSNAIHVAESKINSINAQQAKYAASIRINPYADARNMADPRKIGTGAEFVFGLSGSDIVLDQDVATVVANAMKTSLDDAGFQVREAQDGTVLFELSGTVKELTYDVKARDEVSIAVESTLKEIGSGKVVWSGIVVEKKDRFAGVSGNNKNDVANYLRKELGVVTGKTTKAISDSLMAARPDLFSLTPGTKPISGVTVQTAPIAAPVPNAPAPANAATAPQIQELRANATHGLFLINTRPARAKVYLDGVYYGLSPLRLEMEPGVHALSVKMEGYKTVDEKVSVRKGDDTEMDLTLER